MTTPTEAQSLMLFRAELTHLLQTTPQEARKPACKTLLDATLADLQHLPFRLALSLLMDATAQVHAELKGETK